MTLAHRKPHVEILQTSKQINLEATPVLYRKNGFIVGLKLYARDQTGVDSSDLAGFFLWHLRPATLLQLSCMTFRGACLCDHWLTLSAGACRVFAGTELIRMCADGRPGDRDCKRNGESPQPAYLQFSNSLWELEKGCYCPYFAPLWGQVLIVMFTQLRFWAVQVVCLLQC